MTMKFAEFGSISSGTMRHEDLIPEFTWTLRSLCPDTGEHAELCDEADALEDYDSEQAGFVLDDLFTALEEYAPPYGYFGSHPGDGADFGFWLSDDALAESDALRVSDTNEVPADYTGEVLHTNDHGNLTLYAADRGTLTEVWALV